MSNHELAGIKFIENFELGREIGQAALQTDQALYKDWLRASFPASIGPDPDGPFNPEHPDQPPLTNLDVFAAHMQTYLPWHTENSRRALRALQQGNAHTLRLGMVSTRGRDWLDKDDPTTQTFTILSSPPPIASTPHIRQLIDRFTTQAVPDSVAQSFGGLIFRTGAFEGQAGVVGQLSRVRLTSGYSIEHRQNLPEDALLMRAWRRAF